MRKKITLPILAVAALVIVGCASANRAKLTTKEVAEINDWMYSARQLYQFGDYNLSKYYCEKIIEKYPGTSYARKAASLKRSVEWKVKYR